MSRGVLRDPKLWIGLLISALFIWLALRGVDPASIAHALKQADYRVLPPAVILSYGFVFIRSLRWRILLRGVKEVGVLSPFRATIIGFTVNYLLPARVGELVRAYVLGSREGLSSSAVFATVVVERLLDVFTILLVFLGVTLFVEIPQGDPELLEAFRLTAAVMAAIAIAAVGLLWVVKRRAGLLTQTLNRTLGRVSQRAADSVCRLVESFSLGVVPIRGGRDAVGIVFYTVVLWAMTAVGIILIAEGFRLGLPWEAAWLIMVALAFGVSVPSAPGFVGTFHYAAMVCLLLYGVPRPAALSYAIVLHASNILPVLFLGILMLWGEGLSLRKVSRMKRQEGAEDGGASPA